MQLKKFIKELLCAKHAGIFPYRDKIKSTPPTFSFEDKTGDLPYKMTNDLLVKLLLERNEKVLKSFISALLRIPVESITDIQILNPFFPGQSVTDKNTVLDIHLIINNELSLDLEIQVAKEEFWTNRSILYLCRQYDTLKVGDDYSHLIPSIHIGILDFDLFPEDAPEFFSTYKLLNIKNYKLYSDKLQIHVVNLKQIDYATDEDRACGLYHWACLFKATTWEDLKMLAKQDSIFTEASETIANITSEASLRAYLLSREIAALDALTRENLEKKRQEEMKQLSAEKKALVAEKEALASKLAAYEAKYGKLD